MHYNKQRDNTNVKDKHWKIKETLENRNIYNKYENVQYVRFFLIYEKAVYGLGTNVQKADQRMCKSLQYEV